MSSSVSKEEALSAVSPDAMKDDAEDLATKTETEQLQPIATENGDDETVVRESGPLESNEPRVSKVNVESIVY